MLVAVLVLACTMLAATAAFAEVPVRYEDDAPAIVYNGTWVDFPDPETGGDPEWYSGDSRHYSVTTGDTLSFPFTGTGVDWITVKVWNQAKAEVWVDSEPPVVVDNYNPTRIKQAIAWSRTGLPYGPHTLHIKVLGQWNPAATGELSVSIDAFDVYEEEPPPVVSTPASSWWSIALLAIAALGALGIVKRNFAR